VADQGIPKEALFAVRAMLSALQRSTRLLRRDPGRGQATAAVREFVQRARAATENGLLLELRGRDVFLGGTAVHRSAPGDGLMATLSALGVGGIRFEAAVTDAELRDFTALLASDTGICGAPEDDVVGRFQLAELRHVSLLPAHRAPGFADQRSEPWSVLPRPAQPSPTAQAAVDRELEANLPAQAAQQLLADFAAGTAPSPLPLLERLLQAMLDRGDAAGAAWLLAEAGQGSLDDATSAPLRESALRRFTSAWTAACLDGGPRQVQGLIALALELGEDAVARCLAAEPLLALPEAERFLATMIASTPAAAARAVGLVALEQLPRLLHAIACAGAPLPFDQLAQRLADPLARPVPAQLAAALRELPLAAGERSLLAAALAAEPPRR
jgi:hypothetical protein